ncbi:uncharacterized protein LOC131601173 isoform X2 [Vicia villosa]|uniref:uncharacterized protein LOC131601173 isoform X2 n=1 Tax=Vicia villosa TaxID=3911 RepID=UPI00273C18F1|nr:uncharacterized protein LOC131601173 isoform X2 [Vicia villosa]
MLVLPKFDVASHWNESRYRLLHSIYGWLCQSRQNFTKEGTGTHTNISMEVITEGVNSINISDSTKNRIHVSNSKKPIFFFVNLAKNYLKQYNEVELSALGSAIASVVSIAEILKHNGLAVEKKIRTSTVVLGNPRGRAVQKARIEILLEKTANFDELMAAAEAAGENGDIEVHAAAAAEKGKNGDNEEQAAAAAEKGKNGDKEEHAAAAAEKGKNGHNEEQAAAAAEKGKNGDKEEHAAAAAEKGKNGDNEEQAAAAAEKGKNGDNEEQAAAAAEKGKNGDNEERAA